MSQEENALRVLRIVEGTGVDGPVELDKRDTSLLFRGSSNQRLVDVQQSLATGTVALWRRNGSR